MKISVDLFSLLEISLSGSEVDKPSEILIKTSSSSKDIKSNIQNTEAPRTYDPIIYYKLESILIRFTHTTWHHCGCSSLFSETNGLDFSGLILL